MNWRTALILASSLCQERFYSIRKRSKPAIGQLRSFLRPSFALLRSAFDEDRPHAEPFSKFDVRKGIANYRTG